MRLSIVKTWSNPYSPAITSVRAIITRRDWLYACPRTLPQTSSRHHNVSRNLRTGFMPVPTKSRHEKMTISRYGAIAVAHCVRYVGKHATSETIAWITPTGHGTHGAR
jgi:hypothetical protein